MSNEGKKRMQAMDKFQRKAPGPEDVGWRAGRSVFRTIYLDGVLVGVMDTPALAAEVVAALKARGRLREIGAALAEPCWKGCGEAGRCAACERRARLGREVGELAGGS